MEKIQKQVLHIVRILILNNMVLTFSYQPVPSDVLNINHCELGLWICCHVLVDKSNMSRFAHSYGTSLGK